jgi:protein ImuB
VEPFGQEAGIFWLDASGLRYLFPNLGDWALGIQGELEGIGFRSLVAVGYSRFGSYAAAKGASGNVILGSPAQEKSHMRGVLIERLGIDPVLRDTLGKLGVRTLGEFGKLDAGGIRRRFGAAAEELYGLLHESWEVLRPREIRVPVEESMSFEWPETKSERLLAGITSLLPGVLGVLKGRYEALEALRIFFTLDDRSELEEVIEPAVATLKASGVLGLIRLRLEGLKLSSGVMEILLRGEGVEVVEGQAELFRESGRDVEGAYRAFAAIRADLGNDAVVRAQVMEGHLPEARYGWEVFGELAEPHPREVSMRPLIRRIYHPARELPGCDRRDPDGWLITGVSEGPVEEVIGPHIVSGGWWIKEITRAYYYVRTRRGRWLWIYHDDKRRRWYLQGEVQ